MWSPPTFAWKRSSAGRPTPPSSTRAPRSTARCEPARWPLAPSVEIETLPGYMPLFVDSAMGALFKDNALALVGDASWAEMGPIAASTDAGDLSHVLPVLHPSHGGCVGTNHAADFQIHDPDVAYVTPAKAMAWTIVDLLSDDATQARQVLARLPAQTDPRNLPGPHARPGAHRALPLESLLLATMTDAPHVYVSAYAICVRDGQMLLARIGPGRYDTGRWTLPGGGLNWGESPVDAVLRELTEETGLIGHTPKLADIFSATYARSAERPLDPLHHIAVVYFVDTLAVSCAMSSMARRTGARGSHWQSSPSCRW